MNKEKLKQLRPDINIISKEELRPVIMRLLKKRDKLYKELAER